MAIRINANQADKLLDELENMADEVMKPAGVYFRNKTPVRSGNARNKTKQRNNVITAGYPYAERLDTGWSKQAPKGMSGPTEDEIERLVEKYIKRIT